MFMCFHRCSCVEPSDPTNATLKYWEVSNVTASEIYWEALEVKVPPTPTWFRKEKKLKINKSFMMVSFNIKTKSDIIESHKDKPKKIHFHLKVARSPRWRKLNRAD